MNNGDNSIFDLVREAVNGIGGLLTGQHKDAMTILRQPTPIKITRAVTSDASGLIGGGWSLLTGANSRPVPLWECPMAMEAWINRIVIDAAGYMPANPYTTGNIRLISSSGVPIQYFPIAGTIAPVIVTEGRLSAPHLTSGEYLAIQGESLLVGIQFTINLQIVLVTGVTTDTPRDVQMRRAMDIMP